MKFGLLYETQRPFQGTEIDWNTLYKETLGQCELADQIGFDNLWFVEHHFLTGFSGSPCPEVLMGARSQITKQIRIGFVVSILTARAPCPNCVARSHGGSANQRAGGVWHRTLQCL